MKRIAMFLLVALVLGSQMVTAQEVVYGTVSTDGYYKTTKGYFWSKRPEAKKIYEGEYPSGYSVYTLNADHFVRFADNEHNANDGNYIVFPKGEKIYKNEQTGEFFAAICGNRIIFAKPVNDVKVVEKKVPVHDTVYIKTPAPQNPPPQTTIINNNNNYVSSGGSYTPDYYGGGFNDIPYYGGGYSAGYGGYGMGYGYGNPLISIGINRSYYGGGGYRQGGRQQYYRQPHYQPRPRPQYQPHGSMSGGRAYTPTYNHGSMSGGRGTMSGGGSGYGGGRAN